MVTDMLCFAQNPKLATYVCVCAECACQTLYAGIDDDVDDDDNDVE